MRALLLALVAVTAALVACSSDPAPSCGDLGRSVSCACPGGAQGAQECGPQGVWSACVCPAGDAGADVVAVTDGAREAAVDAANDAPTADVVAVADAGGDAAADVPTCDANLERDPMNCGRCGNVCPRGGCWRGVCQPGVCPTPPRPGAGSCTRNEDCAPCLGNTDPQAFVPCCSGGSCAVAEVCSG